MIQMLEIFLRFNRLSLRNFNKLLNPQNQKVFAEKLEENTEENEHVINAQDPNQI